MMRAIENVIYLASLLTIGYERLLNASGATNEKHLKVDTEELVATYLSNPLGPVFELLASSLISPRAESIELMQTKSREQSPRKSGSPTKKAMIVKPEVD